LIFQLWLEVIPTSFYGTGPVKSLHQTKALTKAYPSWSTMYDRAEGHM